MSRPWNLEGLLAVRVLAAANAPLGAIGQAVDRLAPEIDQALWALVGRTPEQALARLNGERVQAPQAHRLWPRIQAVLASCGATTIDVLAEILAEDPADVDDALVAAALSGLADADDPPPPASRRGGMAWWLRRQGVGAETRL